MCSGRRLKSHDRSKILHYIIVAVERLFFFFLFAWMPLSACACLCVTFLCFVYFFLSSARSLVLCGARCESTTSYQYENTTSHADSPFVVKVWKKGTEIFLVFCYLEYKLHASSLLAMCQWMNFHFSFNSFEFACMLNDLLNLRLFELITFEKCANCTWLVVDFKV